MGSGRKTLNIQGETNVVVYSNLNINRVATVIVSAFVVCSLVFSFGVFSPFFSVSALVLIAAGVGGFLGFGRRSDGILNQGSCGLNVRHGSGNNILGQGVGYNRRWYGWNLHNLSPYIGKQNIAIITQEWKGVSVVARHHQDYRLYAINKHLIN
jgi:hypothetical protein